MPFGGTTTIDDVESGQTGGGVRRHDVPCRLHHPAARLDVRRRDRRVAQQGERQAGDRHGLPHGGPDLREGGTLEELASLPDQGITSYKLFMAYKGALMVDDETLFKTMEVAAETGALVMVHAENGDAIDVLVKKALAEGHTEPHWHALTRPPETGGRGDQPCDSACASRSAPLYVVHVSCKDPSSRSAPAARSAGACSELVDHLQTILQPWSAVRIFEKSSRPIVFCPSQRKRSVGRDRRQCVGTDGVQRTSWFSFARGGGV